MSQSNQEAQDNMCRAIYAAIRRHFNHIIQDDTGQLMLDVAMEEQTWQMKNKTQ